MIQRNGVCIAAWYCSSVCTLEKKPWKSFDKSIGHIPDFWLPFVTILLWYSEGDVNQYLLTIRQPAIGLITLMLSYSGDYFDPRIAELVFLEMEKSGN